MAYNKFITTDGLVLLDLTADTVTANNLAKGIIAHDKSGAVIEGLYEVEEWDGSGVVIEALASTGLITFTVYGKEYQAEDGMTWREWCESDYNTHGAHIDLGDGEMTVWWATGSSATKFYAVCTSDNTIVTETDTITANYAYTTIQVSHL